MARALRQLIGVGLALAAAACGGRAGAAPRETLVFWAFGREGEVVKSLVSDFERENPALHLVVQQIPWTSAHEKLDDLFHRPEGPVRFAGEDGQYVAGKLAAAERRFKRFVGADLMSFRQNRRNLAEKLKSESLRRLILLRSLHRFVPDLDRFDPAFTLSSVA